MQRCIFRRIGFQFLQKRFYRKQIKVRFAPSPTGYLHLGGLRTALYNYLFARANNGTFILRIEDTDQSRIIPGAIEKLQDDLLWAGIIPDEDPIRGGPNGPYIQSKRIDIYKEHVLKLLDNKTAYYCFCQQHRLDLLKREAQKCNLIPKYDNKCRNLDEKDVKETLRKGHPYCIRFKLSSNIEIFNDIVYGEITYDVAQNEGDPVIIKADGYPTYHFANVVDDYTMGISHVLRGVEWQISTPKHIMLYKAFGWTPPVFGHLPLLLNTDGTKLSKRQGDIQVDTYRRQGIFPLALINYVTLAGGGFNKQLMLDHVYSYEELIKKFDLFKINAKSGKLMQNNLLLLNKLEIARLIENQENNKFLTERVKTLLLHTYAEKNNSAELILNEDYIIKTLKWAQNRISTLDDLVTPHFAFLWFVPAPPLNITPECMSAIKAFNKKLTETDSNNFHKDWIINCLKESAENNGIPVAVLMRTLRLILSALKDGPSIAEMIEILGKDKTLFRIQRSIS